MSAAATTSTSAPAAATPDAATAWRTGGLVVVAALVGNLLVWAVAQALGADLLVQQPGGGATTAVAVPMVVGATVAPLVLGTLALVVARRWGARAWRVLAYLGLVAGVVTVGAPLTAAQETGTGLALAAMHLVTGLAWAVLVLRAAKRA